MAQFSFTLVLIAMFFLMFSATILAAPADGAALTKRKSGTATWFDPGLGACGRTNKRGDFIVALPAADYDNGKHCYKVSSSHLSVAIV
jgi:hypothetical protein